MPSNTLSWAHIVSTTLSILLSITSKHFYYIHYINGYDDFTSKTPKIDIIDSYTIHTTAKHVNELTNNRSMSPKIQRMLTD